MNRLFVFAALASLAAAACGGVRARVRELPPSAREFLTNAPAEYGPSSVAPVSRGETDHLRERFEGALDAAVRPRLRRDAALDLVAAVLAETYSEELEATSPSVLQWTLWRSGATGASCGIEMSYSKGGQDDQRTDSLDSGVNRSARIAVVDVPTTYGLARFTEGRVTSQAIVRCEASLAVDPFPKRYAAGAPITIRFKPLDESSHFVFLADTDALGNLGSGATGADGIAERALRVGDDGFVTIEHTAPKAPGRYFVEVRALHPATAHGRPAPRTVLWVPIYVDVPEPTDPDAFMRAAPVTPIDASSWTQLLGARIDAERSKVGLAKSTRDPRLEGLAQARVRLLAKHGGDPGYARKLPNFVRSGDAVWDYVDLSGAAESPEEHADLALLHPSVRKLLRAPKLLVGVETLPQQSTSDSLPLEQIAHYLWAEGASPPAPAEFKVTAPAELTRAPAAEQFLVVPLRVFLMRSSSVAALQTAPDLEGRTRALVDKVNRVWSAAGIHFRLDGVSVTPADATQLAADLEKLPPASRARPPNRLVANAIPAETRKGVGFRLYFIHDFDLNGIFLGRGELIVRETATATQVDGGIDDPIPQTMAHELGHGLGLSHRQDRVSLMSWGTSGIRLTDAEMARARSVAQALPGTETFAQAKQRGETSVVTTITSLAERDVSRWSP